MPACPNGIGDEVDGAGLDLLASHRRRDDRQEPRRLPMAWTRPKLREICIGMEINGYFAGKL